MRIFYALLLLLPNLISAQERISLLVDSEPVYINQVDVQEDGNHIYISSSFGKYNLAKSLEVDQLGNRPVYKVQLVYTSYRTAQSFDQKELNRKRCIALYENFPFLFENELIELELIEQTGCTNRKEGKNFFHGYVITCGELQSEELAEKEMEFLDALFEGEEATCPVKIGGEEEVSLFKLTDRMPFYADGEEAFKDLMSACIRYPFDAAESRLYGTSEVKIEIKNDGTLGKVSVGSDSPIAFNPEILKGVEKMDKVEPAIADGNYSGSTVDIVVNFSSSDKSAEVVGVRFNHEPFPTSLVALTEETAGGRISLSSSVVTKTLNRNKWNNTVIVADVTGSMSPFTGQLIQFLQDAVAEGNVRKVGFFNDGDSKSSGLKIVGKTGGIYFTDSCEMNEVKKKLKKAMANGAGGELEENDIEAVLEAQENCSDCASIVLIADNYAPIRDVKLIKKIEKPVHVVVCNFARTLNVDYLNLALYTKGSIHVRGQDYVDLEQYSEEIPLVVGGVEYQLVKGEFISNKKSHFNHPVMKH